MADEKPELAFNWTTPEPSRDVEDQIDRDIEHDDETPSIIEQAKSNGWNCQYYSFGKAEDPGTDYFNPGIIERPDGLWLLTRASGLHPMGFMYGQNAIIAFKLNDNGKQPCYGKVLQWPVDNPEQHFEDPRGFYHPAIGQTLIGCCTFMWNGPGDWTGPHQAFGAFDEEWNCKKMDYPLIGGNPGTMEKIKAHKDYEKNWLWFLHEGSLVLLYKANPWTVVVFGNRWSEKQEIKIPGVTWPYGEIRGGTTPVRVGDMYFTFHHSSLPWKGRYRRYYAGCLAFDAKPPFTPRLVTSEPILIGSQNDTWAQRKPLVVFPCGAIYKNETWLVTLGVNDMVSAYLELPHKDLFARMQPVEDVADPIFTDYALPKEKTILPVSVLTENQTPTYVEELEAIDIADGEARESTTSAIVGFTDDSRGGQKSSKKKRKPFSPEALANLRAAAAKARAARMEKRVGLHQDYEKLCENNGEPPLPKRRRKRRRVKKPKDIEARRVHALEEWEKGLRKDYDDASKT